MCQTKADIYRIKGPLGSLSKLVAILMVSVVLPACSSSDIPNVENSTSNTPYPLAARVVESTETHLTVEYTIENNSDQSRIIFDVGQPLRSKLVDGDISLFKGQYNPDVSSVSPLLIVGQILGAGESFSEQASRDYPTTIDFAGDQSTTEQFTDFEFCITHSDPDDQERPPQGETFYYLRAFSSASRNECVMLSRY